MEKELKYLQTFEQSTDKNLNISDVIVRLFNDVSKSSNVDKDRIVCGYSRGKLSFYELDLHEETVKRYLTTVSLNVL